MDSEQDSWVSTIKVTFCNKNGLRARSPPPIDECIPHSPEVVEVKEPESGIYPNTGLIDGVEQEAIDLIVNARKMARPLEVDAPSYNAIGSSVQNGTEASLEDDDTTLALKSRVICYADDDVLASQPEEVHEISVHRTAMSAVEEEEISVHRTSADWGTDWNAAVEAVEEEAVKEETAEEEEQEETAEEEAAKKEEPKATAAGWTPAGWTPVDWAPSGWTPVDWAPADWAPSGWAPVGWPPVKAPVKAPVEETVEETVEEKQDVSTRPVDAVSPQTIDRLFFNRDDLLQSGVKEIHSSTCVCKFCFANDCISVIPQVLPGTIETLLDIWDSKFNKTSSETPSDFSERLYQVSKSSALCKQVNSWVHCVEQMQSALTEGREAADTIQILEGLALANVVCSPVGTLLATLGRVMLEVCLSYEEGSSATMWRSNPAFKQRIRGMIPIGKVFESNIVNSNYCVDNMIITTGNIVGHVCAQDKTLSWMSKVPNFLFGFNMVRSTASSSTLLASLGAVSTLLDLF